MRRLGILLAGPLTRGRVERPLFIVGCGRSGTTILGRILARHPDVTYLNEPRFLWNRCFPAYDIWGGPSASGEFSPSPPDLVMTRADADPEHGDLLHRYFRAAVRLGGGRQLVEKTPINAFRVDFLTSLFPDARFVHLVRSGPEVARSIERFIEAGGDWFGAGDRKWSSLVAYARSTPRWSHLPEVCGGSDFTRGLMEWRLSVETALEALASLPDDRQLRVGYRGLLVAPRATVASIFELAGLPASPTTLDFAERTLDRRSPELPESSLDPAHRELIGDLHERLGLP